MKYVLNTLAASALALASTSASFAGGQTAPAIEGEPLYETQTQRSIGSGSGLLVGALVIGGLVLLGGGSDSGTAAD